MARSTSLDAVINAIFQGGHRNSRIEMSYGRTLETTPVTSKKYMEIPISGDVIELPLLAFDAFRDIKKRSINSDVLVAQLYSCGTTSDYKSLDAIMRDTMSTNFNRHLMQVQIAGCPSTYYATYGAVFNDDLKPLMMLSWIMEKKADGDGRLKYHYKRPLLRINPGVCVSKEDNVQRFIANKVLLNSLNYPIATPYFFNCDAFIDQTRDYSSRSTWAVKVEIDECPFYIKTIDTPSISVTNEGLLQLAADHIEEILQ